MADDLPPPQPVRVFDADDDDVRVAMDPPRDVAGWEVEFRASARYEDDPPLLAIGGTAVTLSDPAGGVWDFRLTRADKAALGGPGLYVWSFRRVDAAAGAGRTIARGTLRVLEMFG